MSVTNPIKTPDVEVLLAGNEPELLDSLRTMLQDEAYRLIIALNRDSNLQSGLTIEEYI